MDGIIGMEGNGPTTGDPVLLGLIIAGTNPYLLDMVAARVVGCDFDEIPVLKEAMSRGQITQSDINHINSLPIDLYIKKFKRPEIPLLTKIVTNKKLQKYFLVVRHAPLISQFFNSSMGNKLLFKCKLTQEIFNYKEVEKYDMEKKENNICKNCNICDFYCPIYSAPSKKSMNEKCIQCLYCFSICPEKNINIGNKIGFYQEQIKQYDNKIRDMIKLNKECFYGD